MKRLVLLAGLSVATGCAGVGVPASGGTATPRTSGGDVARVDQGWSVSTREHVDLWLHGFPMLTADTSRVPLFQRGYRQRMTSLKRQRNAFTALDANQEKLSARFAANPSLVNAQFVALYFPSLEEIVTATNYFIQAGGNPQRASDPTVQQEIALLAANFPSAADRDWLRLFVQGLQDESSRFYHAYWNTEQQSHTTVRAEIETRWRNDYYAKFRRFLANTQQAAGELILSFPLDGEGRTINDAKRANAIAVSFPETQATALEAMYVFAHEAVGNVAATAITDNVTPAEQRSGVTARYQANGAVRGGALLLQRVAPELAQGYMRYYLRSAAVAVPSGDASAAFAAAFSLPDSIRDAISRQIEAVLGGI
jgi:hypothetical protein